ncbi:Ig-like domain-containing protein [Streptomyces sioyaensis]|uniref:L,D-transpeptidase n=1 Tax=Streptomyces sioyaensis TaxID=67364 RepID=UPI0037D075A6
MPSPISLGSKRRTGRVTRYISGALISGLLIGGCSAGGSDASGSAASKTRLTLTPAAGTKNAPPGVPVEACVDGGTLTSVKVTDSRGKDLPGTLAHGAARWTSQAKTAPDSTYRIQAATKSRDGTRSTQTRSFTTRKADKTNKVTVTPAPGTSSTVGVAQPISLVFDTPVTDKAAVQKQLKVITQPQTTGSWGWIKDYSGKDRVDWRPKDFWKPGTKVSLKADLTGIASSDGTYFARDYTTTFTIGSDRRIEVDVPSHRVKVTENGNEVLNVPMSAGDDKDPGKATRGGTHVILRKNPKETLDSSTVGFGSSYNLPDVPWVVHITSSGTFFHSAPWNTANIGRRNTSHGCIGMTVPDAERFYNRVQVGDPVEVKGSTNTTATDPGNGFGEWQLTWPQWQSKSAQ